MTMTRSRSPARARSASPRRSPSASPVQPSSPHSDAYDGEANDYDAYDDYEDYEDYEDYNDDESGAQDRELTHEEKVRRCLADSPSPTGSPMRQDDSLLTIDGWKAKSEKSDRKAGVEYVRHSQTKELFRVDRREKESMGNYITTLEAEAAKVKTLEAQVARLKEQMASMQAKKDKKILALESGFKALGLDTQATATPAPTIAKCSLYDKPRAHCRPGCTRMHVGDEVKVAKTGEKVEMMDYK